MPFALARGEQLAAFFFTHPLHVTRAREHNKVLWVLARPTGGEPLEITATRAGRSGAVRTKTDPGLGGNGQIQRSALDFPAPDAGGSPCAGAPNARRSTCTLFVRSGGEPRRLRTYLAHGPITRSGRRTVAHEDLGFGDRSIRQSV